MMRTVLLFILFLVSFVGFGQCPTNGPTVLESQSEIDAFAMTYPGCTEFGTIQISGMSGDIVNLEGLSQIEIINGDFFITNTYIQTLNGLENLKYVTHRFIVDSNDFLQSAQGLNQLETVGSFLSFHGNGSLQNLSGFDSLTSVGRLRISYNFSLLSLSGLDHLSHIDRDLLLTNNNVLEDLSGLSGLVNINGGLKITYNRNLQNLNGLEALESIEGTLNITGNNNLQSLSKLESLDPQSIAGEGYLIQDNPNLSVCDIDFICQNLYYPGVQVNDNAPGCNNILQIEYQCSLVDIPDPLFRTAVLNHIPVIDTNGDGEIQYVEAENFNGILEVSNRNISSFVGLEAFINISGLDASRNSLYVLDLSSNISVESVDFSNNTLLENVNLRNGNNTAIQTFQGTNCPSLTYICVDDAIYATNNFVNVDPQVIFTEDCTLSSADFILAENIKCFPNPFSSIFNIETSNTISFVKATVYSTLGKLILESSEKQINLENLSAGIYFVEVVTDKGSVTKKIVKE